jgi:Xaa-Pro aminopeptidase
VTRLAALGERLEEPLLVTNGTNVRWLTGFSSSNGVLLVRPGGETTLYTDFRYLEAARAVEGVEVERASRTLFADLAGSLQGEIGFEADDLSYATWQVLAAGGASFVPRSGLVEALRAVKDEEEIAAIRRVARLADRAFEALTAETWVGRTEKEVAWRLQELLHAHGADGLSFETIVASGPNGARPHARPTDRLVERNTLVTVDWGAVAEGYCSDCTRTVATGELSGRLREIYEVCLGAQEAAVAGIRPGMTGVEADALAREPIAAAGYGEAFGHGLGHGVGLAVHEAPTLSPSSEATLAVGNVVTVEPGIYLEGESGVRIEDLAVVREDGAEVLTSFPKQLIVVS